MMVILAALIGYALGDINPAIVIGRIKHIDIRNEGSGNAGMTNTIRVIGLWAGIVVFVVDVLKAVISVKLGYQLADVPGEMAGFAGVVIGHCYPALYGFKGGKGVAASLGAALALDWRSALCALLIAGVIFLISNRKMSLASICAAASFPIFVRVFNPDRRVFVFSICAVVFLVIQHTANIKRIARGEEESLTIAHADKNKKNDNE